MVGIGVISVDFVIVLILFFGLFCFGKENEVRIFCKIVGNDFVIDFVINFLRFGSLFSLFIIWIGLDGDKVMV